jgi:Tfp pilus assembly protein PilF
MGYLSQRLGLTRYEADEYYALALDAYQKGKLDDAIDNITHAITLLPVNAEYHAVRGLFFMEDGVVKEARENFEVSLQHNAGEILANYGMGVLAYQDKDWSEATRWFNRARAVNPIQSEIPYYLALIAHRQQDNNTAKTYMEQALQLMEDAGDKRRADARRWIREFEKLIKQATEPEDEPSPVQQTLPIREGGNMFTVSREELEASRSAGELAAGPANDSPDE